MSHRGNIIFKSIEAKFDKQLGGYRFGDNVKRDYMIIDEYYLSLGYYVFLSNSIWMQLFECILWEDMDKEGNINFSNALIFGWDGFDFPFSFDRKKIKTNFDNALEMLDKEFNYNNKTLLRIWGCPIIYM